jgi:hypothetical protein
MVTGLSMPVILIIYEPGRSPATSIVSRVEAEIRLLIILPSILYMLIVAFSFTFSR